MLDLVSYKKTVDSAFDIIRNCGFSVGDTVYRVVNNEIKKDTIIHIEFTVSTNLVDYQEYSQSANKYGLYIVLKERGSFKLEEFNRKFSKDMIQAVKLEEQRLHDSWKCSSKK